MARIYNTKLNKSSIFFNATLTSGGILVLFFYLRGKTFHFSLSIILTVSLLYTPFIMLNYVPSVVTLLRCL